VAAKIPHNFQEAGEAAIASFDFEDIASGKAYQTFYGFDANRVQDYFLTPVVVNSQTIKTYSESNEGAEGAFSKESDVDFDITFNVPRTIQGDALVNVTCGMTRVGGTNAICHMFPWIRIKKNDTELVSLSGAVLYSGALGTTQESKMYAFNMTVPKTHLKIGDTLRITTEIYAVSGSNKAYVGFAHDPADRNDDDVAPKIIKDSHTTVFKAQIPFKPDL